MPPVTLHLVDPSGPGAARWLCRLARAHAGHAQMVALGSRPVDGCVRRIPVPAGSVRLAAAALERLAEETGAALLVAWGVRPVQAASRARDGAGRLLVMDTVPEVAWVPFDAEVLCLGDAVADRAMQAGWPPMRIRVLAPPVPAMAEPDPSGTLRSAWRATRGIPASAFVVGLLSASPADGHAQKALHAVGRVRMAGVDARLVLDPAVAQAGAMQVFARSIGLRDAVVFDPESRTPERLAAAVDAWISIPCDGNDGTALDPAVGAGLHAPLVVSAGSLAARGVVAGAEALVAEPPNAMAAALLGLAEDRARGSELASALRVRYASEAARQAFAAFIAEAAARASIRHHSSAAESA